MRKEIRKKIEFEQVLSSAIKLPMVHIGREKFLRTELQKYCEDETVEEAIRYNPAYAGISPKTIDKIANNCIVFEAAKVSAISFAAGIPGGFAMVGTIPADFVQYFAHILRIMQKLCYLYGWQELIGENNTVDDGTKNLLILFTGVMLGIESAAKTVSKISLKMSIKAAKALPQKALTKGVIYPIAKKVASVIGAKMTEEVFAKGVAKVIPVVGGFVSGGLTFASYKPMAKKLKKYLSELKTADPEYYQNMREKTGSEYSEYIEAECVDTDDTVIQDDFI